MNYQHKYLKYKSKYLEKKYGRKFRFRYKIDYDNDLDYKQKYLKYKSKYLNIYLKHGSANNNLDYQKKYFKYKSKYLNIKYGGTCKLKIDLNYDNNLDYQQKYFKYKSKYLYFKKQQEGGVFGVLGAIFNPIGKVLAPVTTQVTTPVIALLTPPASPASPASPVKVVATPVKAPAATSVKAPAATSVKAPAATPVKAPAAVAVKAPAAKVVVKPVAVPVVPALPENTLKYTLINGKEITVLKQSNKTTGYFVNFLKDLFKSEIKKDGMVTNDRYNDITIYIDKVIRDRSQPSNRNYGESDYNFDNFNDVAHMVENVTSKAIRLYLQNTNAENLATIMKRVIAEYFNPEYKSEKIVKKSGWFR